MAKTTIKTLQKMKLSGEKIVAITAYDALFARLFDDYADIVLVGDSLNMSFGGMSETLGLEVGEMIYHARAVRRALKKAFLVVDMPFGSTATPQIALKNALKIYKKTGCDAVKIEGGEEAAETISLLTQNGIAVMGHIGLRPQQSRFEGGFLVKGRGDGAQKVVNDAICVAQAGAASMVIEGTISQVANEASQKSGIVTIGIGSGGGTDGQILVWSDLLGLYEQFVPKFVKRYANGAQFVREAVGKYRDEVKNGVFPSSEFEYEN